MFTDVKRGSDEWVANRLAQEIDDRNAGERRRLIVPRRGVSVASYFEDEGRPGLDVLQAYYSGRPPLPTCADGWQEAVVPLLQQARLNVTEMTVTSLVDCMTPIGWSTAVDDDLDGDQVAQEIAVENDLPTKMADVAQAMATFGDGYAIVGGSPAGRIPLITCEDPRSCITREDPATGVTLYGFKKVRDDWTDEDAWFLYGPGWVRKSVVDDRGGRRWVSTVEGSVDTGRARIPGHGEWCAVHRVPNRDGVGDFERHLGSADRIIDGMFGRIVIAKFQAYRQRGIKGLPDTERDPVSGEQRDVDYSDAFLADPGSLWKLPEGAEVWESTPVDLGPIRAALLDDVKLYCALTNSPIYFLFPDEQQSAAGAGNQSQAHETRVLERRNRMGTFQSRLLGHAFETMGDLGRANPGKLRTVWGPVRRFSPAEQAQMFPAFTSGGVPWAERMTHILQISPSEIGRLTRQRAADMLYADVTASAPMPGPLAGPTPPARPTPPGAATPIGANRAS